MSFKPYLDTITLPPDAGPTDPRIVITGNPSEIPPELQAIDAYAVLIFYTGDGSYFYLGIVLYYDPTDPTTLLGETLEIGFYNTQYSNLFRLWQWVTSTSQPNGLAPDHYVNATGGYNDLPTGYTFYDGFGDQVNTNSSIDNAGVSTSGYYGVTDRVLGNSGANTYLLVRNFLYTNQAQATNYLGPGTVGTIASQGNLLPAVYGYDPQYSTAGSSSAIASSAPIQVNDGSGNPVRMRYVLVRPGTVYRVWFKGFVVMGTATTAAVSVSLLASVSTTSSNVSVSGTASAYLCRISKVATAAAATYNQTITGWVDIAVVDNTPNADGNWGWIHISLIGNNSVAGITSTIGAGVPWQFYLQEINDTPQADIIVNINSATP